MQKGLGLCLGGEVRQVCSSMDMASWRLVVEQFSSFEVLGVTTGDGCATLQQQLEASLPDGMPQVGCYGRDGVAELFEARVQRFAERGWQFRNASHLGPPPADGHLRADGSYHFRSAFFQAYQRLQCAAWVRGRQEQGVQFKWVMFARLDVEWRSFPAERELEHHLPVLWLQHRSVNFLQPVPSDRMHVGRSEVILPLLERLFDFLMDLEALVERWGESLAFATCLGRPGKARFTCPPDYGPEDLVELFLLFASMPARIHPEICFDMRSSRHHSERCGQAIENNCRAQATDPQAGYVVAPRRRAYTHAYSQGDEYDSLLAIKLDQILALDADRLGFDMQAVDVGAGVGTYVSLLRQLGADICGLDGRRDLSDSLGEDAIIHDISLPLPRVLVYRFHWVFCFNMLEHLPASWSITELRQVVLNLADLAAVGVLITVPENAYVAGPSADAEPLEVEYVVDRGLQAADFFRDAALEAEIFREAGLLCCRGRLRRLFAFRRAEVPASAAAHLELMGSMQRRGNDGMRRRRGEDGGGGSLLVPYAEQAPRRAGPSGGPRERALPVGIAEDWLDLQVPRQGLVWGTADRDTGPLRLLTVLYLKLFRLLSVSEAQLQEDLQTLDQSEGDLLREVLRQAAPCAGAAAEASAAEPQPLEGGPRGACDVLLAAAELLEGVAARLACFGLGCQAVQVDCSGGDAPGLLVRFSGAEASGALPRDFPAAHSLAQAVRCLVPPSPGGLWPPVSLEFAEGFSGLRRVRFAPSLWGKYMLRVHGLAGVRS